MNWGELKSATMAYLEAGSAPFVANLPLYARLCEEDIQRQVQLPLTRQTSTTQTFVTTPYIALPIDYLSTYYLSVTVLGEQRMLYPKEQSYLVEAFPSGEIGVPRYYAMLDEANIVLAPAPNQEYAVTMNYFKKATSITSSDDAFTTWLSINAENAMLFGMLYHAYIFEKGDQDVIQAYKGQFDKAMADLKIICEGRNRKDTNRMPDQRVPT